MTALLLSLFLAVPAQAEPGQVPLSEVLSKLGVQSRPADYVVLVDTSGSMVDGGRYTQVKSALAAMLGALQPTDRVALVSFDSTAIVRFDGLVGTAPQAPLASLPPEPTGQRTDIGAGLDAGLRLLESDTAQDVGAIALITDGRLDAPGSPYADPASPAWAALRARADAVTAKHEVAAYALGLISATDAALLHTVFPKAADVPASEFSTRLAALQKDLVSFQAHERLRDDVGRGVRASWTGINWAQLPPGGSVEGTLTLTSGFTAIPVTLSGLRVDAGPGVGVRLSTDTPELGPGAAVSLPVTVTLAPGAEPGPVEVAGTCDSPWRSAITQGLGLTFAPTLTAGATRAGLAAPAAPASGSIAPPAPAIPTAPLLASAATLAVAVGAVVALRYRRRLEGSVCITSNGLVAREFLLEGRSMTFDDQLADNKLRVRLRAAGKNATPAVLLDARAGHQRVKKVLADGDVATVGDVAITYTAQRSRSMAIITAGIETS